MVSADALSDPIRLLFVEDDDDYRAVLKTMVQRLGLEESLEVLFLSRVQDAHRAMESSRVDVILSDYHLPDGTGTDVLSHARTAAPEAQRIVLTAHPELAHDTRGESMADAIWEKTFNVHDLRRRLERVVEARRSQRLARTG